ncbi:glucose-1-phosphate cytidylyltransferase [Candidatus Micrarchaeota archaeon]|nr:MAG: glucose-1-phosphate cytidylyltransferase [Candidatus Micrarchaeota archaeon]
MVQQPKVVILCGGMGTRLREETEVRPKPLVEIGQKPILWHIMKLYAHHKFTNFVLCLGYKGNMIMDYFKKNNDEGWIIEYADTGEKTNTGERIKRIEKYIDEENFLATYGDGVSTVDLRALYEFHLKHNKIATITCVHPYSKYGQVEISTDASVKQFIEKPVLRDYINGGFHVYKREFFDYLGENDVLEHAPFSKLVEKSEMMAFKHEGFWHSMDTWRDKQELNAMWKSGKAPWKVW